jgi:hypothetical protein
MMTGQESIAFLRPVHREYGRPAARLHQREPASRISKNPQSFAPLPTYRWRADRPVSPDMHAVRSQS